LTKKKYPFVLDIVIR